MSFVGLHISKKFQPLSLSHECHIGLRSSDHPLKIPYVTSGREVWATLLTSYMVGRSWQQPIVLCVGVVVPLWYWRDQGQRSQILQYFLDLLTVSEFTVYRIILTFTWRPQVQSLLDRATLNFKTRFESRLKFHLTKPWSGGICKHLKKKKCIPNLLKGRWAKVGCKLGRWRWAKVGANLVDEMCKVGEIWSIFGI